MSTEKSPADRTSPAYAADRLDEIAEAAERTLEEATKQTAHLRSIDGWVSFMGVLILLALIFSVIGVVFSIIAAASA